VTGLGEAYAALRRDTAARAQLIQAVGWLAPVFWLGLWLVARVLRDRGHLGPAGYARVLVLNVVLALVLAMIASRVFRLAAQGLVQVATGSGNLKPDPSFSLEEAMIARGNIDAARATLQARLTGGPEDTAVRLRLADLEARIRRDPAEAERWYLEARRGPCDDRQKAAIANGLIDLYRVSGQSGRLMAELSRFAAAWPGTRAAEDARRELRQLKEDPR